MDENANGGSIEERGATLLKFHPVQNEPGSEQQSDRGRRGAVSAAYWTTRELPCLGMRGFSLTGAGVLSRPVEVALWYRSILEGCRRE